MRAALRGLTTRGRCLLAAGAAAALCALVLGQKDLLRVALLLLVLPILSVLMVARTRFRISCTRELLPSSIIVGDTTEVRLHLRNVSLLPTALLLLEDELPFALGGRPRFTVDRMHGNGTRTVRYAVRSSVRGRFPIGPLRLRLTDPFGLVELTRSFATQDLLRVAPAVLPLPAVKLGGTWGIGRGTSDDRSVTARGENDATTREYRYGDDLRRVHWRSSARVGKLMVRREELPWRARAVLLLDTRIDGHRGDSPDSSFEWAVSASASIGVHLLRRGYEVDIMTEQGLVPGAAASESVLLDFLTEVQLFRYRSFDRAATELRLSENAATVIAILGTMQSGVAETLARARPGAASVAVILDAPTWVTLTPASAQRAARMRDETRGTFASHGWRVVAADRSTPISTAWVDAGAPAGVTGAKVAAPRTGTSPDAAGSSWEPVR
ncbi:MAG: DUF58 domain-containing protein [Mycobacteriales bacterium]